MDCCIFFKKTKKPKQQTKQPNLCIPCVTILQPKAHEGVELAFKS